MPKYLHEDLILTNLDREPVSPPSNQNIFISNYLSECLKRNIPLSVSINTFMGKPQPEWTLCLISNYELAHAFMLIEMHKRMHSVGIDGDYDA